MEYKKIGPNSIEIIKNDKRYKIDNITFDACHNFTEYKGIKWKDYYDEEPNYDEFVWFIENVVLVNQQYYKNQSRQQSVVDYDKIRKQKQKQAESSYMKPDYIHMELETRERLARDEYVRQQQQIVAAHAVAGQSHATNAPDPAEYYEMGEASVTQGVGVLRSTMERAPLKPRSNVNPSANETYYRQKGIPRPPEVIGNLPKANSDGSILTLSNIDPQMWIELVDRWESDVLNALLRMPQMTNEENIIFVENCLGEIAKNMWNDWKRTYPNEFKQLLMLSEQPRNITSQVRQMIFGTDPYRGRTDIQDEAMRELDKITLDDFKDLKPFSNAYIK